jgi:serine/threonine protein kinase
MIEPGKILQQRYRIDKQIGQGGMGAVYVATDERFNSMVAIKETLCMDDNYRKALEREARLLNSLKHAALPRVSDHFIEENGQFLVMEYIPGDDLAVILEKTEKPFPFERVQIWADQLLDALEFLHTQSMPVIHRDIKPQNLKLTARDHIVLLDFGLAKGNPTDAGFQTAAKSIFGYSRNYASLEQIQGTGTDPRSDLYSLAATLYHLTTGQAPEDALTRAMAVLSEQPDPLVPANSLNAALPAGFAGVLHKALDLNAASRPAAAHEMREMLGNMDAYAHVASEARAAATVPNVDLGAQKTRLMPGKTDHGREQAGVKTEVLPAYISEETSVRPAGSRNVTDPEPPAPARRPLRRFAFAAAGLLLLLCGLTAGAYVLNPSMFLHESKRPPDPPPAVPAAEQPPAVVADSAPAEEALGDETAGGTGVEEPEREKETEPSRQPAKTGKSTASVERPAANSDADNESDSGGKTVQVGNIKVYGDGKVETGDHVVDEKGVNPKAPRIPNIGPNGLPDMRYMTPAQRRRIMELRRRGLLPPARRIQPRNDKY